MEIQVFQNYLAYIPDYVYELLISYGILDGLKFPGTSVDSDTTLRFIDLVRTLNCSVDNHGWNGITGRLHDPNFLANLSSNQVLKDYLSLRGASSVYSGHLGVLNGQQLASDDILNSILSENVRKIREFIKSLNPEASTEVYGEGIFPVHCMLETSRPDFLNNCVSNGTGLDGLVLDLCHSAITAAYIYAKNDPAYNYYRFLDELMCDKVGMLHLSGGYVSPSSCGNFKNDDIIDPHVPCSLDDYNMLLSTLERCPNAFRLSNELAFVCLDRSIPVSAKIYITEALLTKIAVQTRDMSALYDVQDYLFSASFEDRDECGATISAVKKRYLGG